MIIVFILHYEKWSLELRVLAIVLFVFSAKSNHRVYWFIYHACNTVYFAAISLAINRDGSSGGVIRLACITKDGVERHVLTGDQIPKFYEDS